jgi:hypothetical protein
MSILAKFKNLFETESRSSITISETANKEYAMTQKDRLLNHLRTHKSINPLQSWQHLGIYRLAAVILLLRNDGHSISTVKTEVKNQFGETCNVATYVLNE